ncbi:semaphorin-4C-like isoform X1 [Lampetra fluviatilis]
MVGSTGLRQGRRCAHGMASPSALLLTLLCLSPAAISEDPTPRIVVRYDDVRGKGVSRFSESNTHNLSTLLLHKGGKELFVGARDAIFALNADEVAVQLKPKISWQASKESRSECEQKGRKNETQCSNFVKFLQFLNETHIYACGTYAFQPTCTYVNSNEFVRMKDGNNVDILENGKGKCPFDPEQGYTALIADGDFYAATTNNFLGTEMVISRNLGSRQALKSDYVSTWLNEPIFVGSSFIQESVNSTFGDDDKIYFFFTETAKEYEFYSKPIVSRIARVCKDDAGGKRILQKRWTTYLKAQIVCAQPEIQFHFNVIRDIFVLQPADSWEDTVFFGVFTSQWSESAGSAVCSYSIKDAQKVFMGPFKEFNEATQKWGTHTGSLPSPRPGECITAQHRQAGYNSTLDLPDQTLTFAREHHLMDELLQPLGVRPLFFKRGINYTQLAVVRVSTASGDHDVFFLGTGNGRLHKAVSFGKMDTHIIEELQIFPRAEPVQNLLLSKEKNLLYVGSISSVLQLPLANCSRYRSCLDCLLARDPFCGWNKAAGACSKVPQASQHQSGFLQEFNVNNIAARCSAQNAEKMDTVFVAVPIGGGFKLNCELRSKLAKATWLHNGKALAPAQGSELRPDGLIVVSSQYDNYGTYECFSVESDTSQLAARYLVNITIDGGSYNPLTPEPRNEKHTSTVVVVLSLFLATAILVIIFLCYMLLRNRQNCNLSTVGCGASKSPNGGILDCCSTPKRGPNGHHHNAPVFYSSRESILDKLKGPGTPTKNLAKDLEQNAIPKGPESKPFIIIADTSGPTAETSI